MRHITRTLVARRGLAALLLLLTPAAASCKRDPGPGEVAAPGRAEVVVRLGYQKIGPPFLLKERNPALDGHLGAVAARTEWIEFQSGPPILEAIAAGAVDIGYVGETPPVFAQAGGVPFVYVAADPPAPKAEAILVRKDSPIQTSPICAARRWR